MENHNQNIKTSIQETIKKIASFMAMECQVDLKEESDDKNNKSILVSVYTPENARFLIGKDGQNLKCLEHLLRAMYTKKMEGLVSIVVDVNDYKKSRSSYLIDIARQAVMRVRSTQKAEALLPMSSYERRIVHMELASYPDITTESIGSDPQRRIVVKLYP